MYDNFTFCLHDFCLQGIRYLLYHIWHNMHAIDTMYIVFIYELQALSDELYLVNIYIDNDLQIT